MLFKNIRAQLPIVLRHYSRAIGQKPVKHILAKEFSALSNVISSIVSSAFKTLLLKRKSETDRIISVVVTIVVSTSFVTISILMTGLFFVVGENEKLTREKLAQTQEKLVRLDEKISNGATGKVRSDGATLGSAPAVRSGEEKSS